MLNPPTLRPRRHAYGLTIMEVRLPEIPFLLFPDPGLTDPAAFFLPIQTIELSLSNRDRSDEVRSDGYARRRIDVYDWSAGNLDSDLDTLDRDPDPELVRYQLRREKEIDAARVVQPGDWGWRYYMSETGLRCRSCHTLFEDADHAAWCPVG